MTRQLPTFVIIGAQKSATRWLRDVLDAHPQVSMASRELEFFNHHYEKGLGWYSSQFPSDGDWDAVGEATPGYMMWTDNPRRCAARIDGCLPGARLVALLRNPVDRLVSAYIHHARMGRLADDRSLVEHVMDIDPEVDPMGLVSGGWYGRSLEPYVRRFGARLQVILQDEVRDDPTSVYARVLDHIGSDPRFRHAGLQEVRHSNRGDVAPNVLEAAQLSDAERAELYDRYFQQDVEHLAAMVDAAFSRWQPSPG